MPALAPAPSPRPRIAPAPEIELPAVSFFGRSLAEYVQFFALDLPILRGRDILDVAAGPSSFTAEACARKIDAVAVDPLYGQPLDTLAAQMQLDYAHMFEQMHAKRRLFRFKHFPSIDAAELERRAAAQRFLADYATHFAHNRYVGASLPRLPFFDGTFDLVLCAHLLFTYAQRFDYDWHLAACRELVRVSADKVRIHPLCSTDGKPYPALARLRRELKEAGIASEVRAVDYEFFAGATSMLVLRRNPS
ncbi:MAG: class I SAM-dependent methyltransferase [Opitutaceae bacterium]